MREDRYRAIVEARARRPEAIAEAAAARQQPASLLGRGGRLLLGALDGKVVIGSMNRGGLAGTVFEVDDRFTAYDAAAVDAAAALLREEVA